MHLSSFRQGVVLKIIITGGAGFIDSAVIRQYIQNTDHEITNLDALTYAGDLGSLQAIVGGSRYYYEHADIRDINELRRVFNQHQPHAIMHITAESHVDDSIDRVADFALSRQSHA